MEQQTVQPDDSPGSRKRLVVAALAVAAPVILFVGLALRGGGDDDGGPSDRDDAGAGAEDESADAPTDGATTTAPAADGETDDGGAADQPAADAPPEVPTPGRIAGTESDRPEVTYPQPTVPDGGCDSVDGTAVIELGDGPSPACVKVGEDQTLVFRNRTGHEISLVAEGINEVMGADGEYTVSRAADAFPTGRSTFWSPGNPSLSGLVEVV